MTLYDDAQPGVATPAGAGRARHRDPATRHRFKVAVWDIDGAFPAVEPVLERMTGAQDRFDFQLVDVSAPVDAWDLDNRADDGTPYLWAERFADRLGRMAMELQVDVLACVTRHWLRDDDYLNIYGWWPERGGPPVLIFSCAGFDELPPEGP